MESAWQPNCKWYYPLLWRAACFSCTIYISYLNNSRKLWKLYSLHTSQLCLCMLASLHQNWIQTEMLAFHPFPLHPVSFTGSGCLELLSSNFCWQSTVKTNKNPPAVGISSWFFQYWSFIIKCYSRVDTCSSVGMQFFPFMFPVPVRKWYCTGIWVSLSAAELKCIPSLNWWQQNPMFSGGYSCKDFVSLHTRSKFEGLH